MIKVTFEHRDDYYADTGDCTRFDGAMNLEDFHKYIGSILIESRSARIDEDGDWVFSCSVRPGMKQVITIKSIEEVQS